MTRAVPDQSSSALERPAPWPLILLFGIFFAAVALAHWTLLQLPYFWDEGGYYVPAALDFYHRWTLIPQYTNAHPPLPNVVLGLIWHVFGFRIVVTRLTACAFAAAGLLAVFELGRRLVGTWTGVALSVLTAVYPIWFTQSSLAHADIFAAAFSLAGLTVYLTAPELRPIPGTSSSRRLYGAAAFFCLAVLAKETAVVQPVVLAGLELIAVFAAAPHLGRAHRRWLAALSAPVPVLALWFAYHRWRTGFTFGNPEFLRYNATANFTLAHVAVSLCYRFLHLFWQRDMWLPLVLALGTLLLPRRKAGDGQGLSPAVLRAIAVLVAANWLAFSVLGGALLTRYLLPMYPLLLLVCLWTWQTRTRHWPWLALVTGAAFVSALWLNPPTYFAPEDNLTYRDMIVVHEEAIRYLQQHAPQATVLTAWPGSAELSRPELGYTAVPFKVFAIEDFSPTQVLKAAQAPGSFDMALVFASHYITPAYERHLLAHPDTRRGRKSAWNRDLSPRELARLLGGRVVWTDNRDGEWAAVLRFDRRYDAQAHFPNMAASPR